MPAFNFLEEIDELPYAVACIGAAVIPSQPSANIGLNLYWRMWEMMTAREQHVCRNYIEDMRLARRPR